MKFLTLQLHERYEKPERETDMVIIETFLRDHYARMNEE